MRKPSRKLRFILISVLATLLLIRFLLMPLMGSYLMHEHELRDAGAIVLLLGSTPVETHGRASLRVPKITAGNHGRIQHNHGIGFGVFEGNTMYLTMVNTNTM